MWAQIGGQSVESGLLRTCLHLLPLHSLLLGHSRPQMHPVHVQRLHCERVDVRERVERRVVLQIGAAGLLFDCSSCVHRRVDVLLQ